LVVPAGTHSIAMRYRNPLVPIGAAITLLTLIAVCLAVRWRGRSSRAKAR
jgi:uncharacterized membrane protein YfhO